MHDSGQKSRRRLDEELVARGLADTRSRAQALILARDVMVNGSMVDRAGSPASDRDDITLAKKPRFASRGGEKLEHALRRFRIEVGGLVAADLGASTGGFTDCLLQHGAARVYAVDVGHGQLLERLRLDPRVTILDRTNARYLEALPEPVDIVTMDLSFISLDRVFPAAANILRPFGICVPLIKPQFEAGRADVGKGGVVRDRAVHRRVLNEVIVAAAGAGFVARGLTTSPIKGPAGNIEFLAWLVRDETYGPAVDSAGLIDRALREADLL